MLGRASLLLGVLSLACGSRSGLAELGAAAGSAGSGAASGGVSSGGGGSGGVPSGGGTSGAGGTVSTKPCSALVIASPFLTPKQPGGALDDVLKLTPTSDDGRQFTSVWIRKTGEALHLRHATLRPWDAWPASGELGPVENPGVKLESSFAVAPGLGANHYALAYRSASGPRFVSSVDAGGGGLLAPEIPVPGIGAMFVTRDLGGHAFLVGTLDVTGPGDLLRVTGIDAQGGAHELTPVGCAQGQAPRSAAVPWADHFIVVASRNGSFVTCPGQPGASPTHLDVLDVPWSGPYQALVTATDGSTIIDVDAARHPAGAYAAWTTSSASPTLWALSVNHVTGAVVGPVPLESNLTDIGVRVSAIGEQLVSARRKPMSIAVRVYDPTLTLVAEAEVPTGPNPMPSAIQGSPASDGAVLAWTEQKVNEFRVHLARLDCVP